MPAARCCKKQRTARKAYTSNHSCSPSLLPWLRLHRCPGLRPAPLTEDNVVQVAAAEADVGIGPAPEDVSRVGRRMVLRPREAVVARDGEAFISLVPEEALRLTVGIDYTLQAEVRLGKSIRLHCSCTGACTLLTADQHVHVNTGNLPISWHTTVPRDQMAFSLQHRRAPHEACTASVVS